MEIDDTLKIKKVATSFIVHENKILVLKRSNYVRTFKEHWAAVSGSIESDETPIECAWREINEETNLNHSDLLLINQGRPIFVPSSKYQCYFLVYPFLFKLITSTNRIVLNEEHSEYQFIDDLRSLSPTVPQLYEAFNKVNIENSYWVSKVKEVVENRSDGASVLSIKAINILNEFCQKHSSNDSKELIEDVKDYGYILMHCRESMASIGNSIASVLYKSFFDKEYDSVLKVKECFNTISNEKITSIEQSMNKIIDYAQHLIKEGSNVLVHSHSSTLIKVLQGIKKKLNVYVTESRPLGEGRNTATVLSLCTSDSINSITLLADSSIANVMNKVDVCIVGADGILKDGSFVNKIGTYTIAICASAFNIPVYVVSDTSKITLSQLKEYEKCSKDLFFDENFNPQTCESISSIEFYDQFFEITPLLQNISIISESGLLHKREIDQKVNEIKKHWDFIQYSSNRFNI